MTQSAQAAPETVYILGAGFSYDAGVPLQSQILESIRDLNPLSAPTILSDMFAECQGRSIGFISKIFEKVPNPRLEDVFTLIDQSIQHRSYCVGYSWLDLEVVRRSLLNAIVLLFHTRQMQVSQPAQNFYHAVAAYLVEERINAGQKNHPFSIVSLNWDCVLENAIYWCLDRCGGNAVDVDYCCYTTPLEGTLRHTPSIHQKAIGLYNIKFIKLHGSVNCVLCPNCNRLYAGLGAPRELLAEYIAGKVCPRCGEIASRAEGGQQQGPVLDPLVISPTFVKEFDNAHIEMIWHNAYVDLCEANRIVFIGYSLPEADYHLRTVLKRAIRRDAHIVVVLTQKDSPPKNCEAHIQQKYAASRYRAFFGEEPRVKFEFKGVQAYFRPVVEKKTLSERVCSLRKLFAHLPTSD